MALFLVENIAETSSPGGRAIFVSRHSMCDCAIFLRSKLSKSFLKAPVSQKYFKRTTSKVFSNVLQIIVLRKEGYSLLIINKRFKVSIGTGQKLVKMLHEIKLVVQKEKTVHEDNLIKYTSNRYRHLNFP